MRKNKLKEILNNIAISKFKDIDLNKLLDNLVQFLIENEFKQILISKLNSDPGSKEILNYFKGIKSTR